MLINPVFVKIFGILYFKQPILKAFNIINGQF